MSQYKDPILKKSIQNQNRWLEWFFHCAKWNSSVLFFFSILHIFKAFVDSLDIDIIIAIGSMNQIYKVSPSSCFTQGMYTPGSSENKVFVVYTQSVTTFLFCFVCLEKPASSWSDAFEIVDPLNTGTATCRACTRYHKSSHHCCLGTGVVAIKANHNAVIFLCADCLCLFR